MTRTIFFLTIMALNEIWLQWALVALQQMFESINLSDLSGQR